jgi:putative ABC transport system permease protein
VQLLGFVFQGGLAAIDTNVLAHYSTGFALSEDSSVLMPLSLAQEFFGSKRLTSISLFLKDEDSTQDVLSVLKDKAKAWNLELDFYDYKDQRVNPFYVGAMMFVYIMNLFFFLIVCGVVILSLLNAIQISILERKSEIGTLLAVGYKQSHIRTLFVIESLVLATVSLLTGIILSFVLAMFVNSLGIQFDIVGNAEKLFLVLHVELWFSILLVTFFMLLVYGATHFICRVHLNLPVMKLLERAD